MIKVTREACENDLDGYLERRRSASVLRSLRLFQFISHSILPVSFSTISTRGSLPRRFAIPSPIFQDFHEFKTGI